MSKELIVKNSIHISATANKVWDLLTNPEQTKKYMFGCETVSDWQVGSTLLWKGVYQEQEMVFVKGHILAIEPGKRLVYTTFDPHSTIEDIPENYLTVVYELVDEDGGILLTASQGDFSTVAEGERRYVEVYDNGKGWSPILEEIKKIAEA